MGVAVGAGVDVNSGIGSRGRFACTDGGRRWRGHRVSHIHLPRLHNTRLLPLTRNAQQRSDHNR